jgi:hypothetical protein
MVSFPDRQANLRRNKYLSVLSPTGAAHVKLPESSDRFMSGIPIVRSQWSLRTRVNRAEGELRSYHAIALFIQNSDKRVHGSDGILLGITFSGCPETKPEKRGDKQGKENMPEFPA